MATLGCPHTCDFCAVPVAWPGYSRRPVGDVVKTVHKAVQKAHEGQAEETTVLFIRKQ